jgi:hypothetical protein
MMGEEKEERYLVSPGGHDGLGPPTRLVDRVHERLDRLWSDKLQPLLGKVIVRGHDLRWDKAAIERKRNVLPF